MRASRRPPAAPRAAHRGAAGFSLVEVLVAMALTLLALALASGLLVESQRRLAAAAAEQRDPLATLALARLRGDLHGASTVAAPPWAGDGTEGPLILLGHPAGTVRWEAAGDSLVRTVLAADGRQVSRQLPVARGLTRWRWRLAAPGLVAVELGTLRHPAALRATAGRGGGLTRPPLPEEERGTLTAALRGAPRAGWW